MSKNNKRVSLQSVHVFVDKVYIKLLKKNMKLFPRIMYQSNEICKFAIQNDWTNLKFVRRKTIDLGILAFNINCEAIKYIYKQPHFMRRKAVMTNGLLLRYIKKQNSQICEKAIKQNPLSLQFVNVPTIKLCRLALNLDPKTISFVPMHILEKMTY